MVLVPKEKWERAQKLFSNEAQLRTAERQEDKKDKKTSSSPQKSLSSGEYSRLLANLKEDLKDMKVGARKKLHGKTRAVKDQTGKTVPPPGIPVSHSIEKKTKTRDLTSDSSDDTHWVEY